MTCSRPWPFSDFAFEIADMSASPVGDPVPAPPTCLHFSGLALADDELLSSADAVSARLADGRLTLDGLLAATGYFTAVLRHGHEVLFLNDLLGCEHLYLYEGAGGAVVANLLSALIAAMRRREIPRRLNLPYAATMLASAHPFFSQCHAHELAVEGVSLIPFDRYAVVSEGRVSLRRKPVAAETFGGPQRSYEALVDEAAAQILANVQALRSAEIFDGVFTDLSAGTDSRVVYGAVVKAGLAREVPVDSWSRDGTGDLMKALRICEYYHAPFFEGLPVPRFGIGAKTSLDRWRAWHTGMYHRIYTPAFSTEGGGMRSVRLTGGCGEAYGVFWSKWLDKALGESTAAAARTAIFDRLAPEFPAPHRQSAMDWLFAVIDGLPGEGLAEKLDNHYLFFRNRMHFGMPALRMHTEGAFWAPMAAPAMLLASRKLPWSDRRDARLAFDVQMRLAPELNFFPYGKRVWPERFLPPRTGLRGWLGGLLGDGFRDPGRRVDVAAGKARWDEAQSRRKEHSAGLDRSSDEAMTPEDFRAFCRATVAASYPRVVAAAPELAAFLGPNHLERTLGLFDDGSDDKSWRIATSKITSLADMLLDPEP